MTRWRCTVCGYIYDEAVGEPNTGTPPGTRFADLPEDWRCPVCGAGKEAFVEEREAVAGAAPSGTVADLIMAELAAFGVRYVFGIPGTSSLGLVDAVRRNPALDYVVVRHEANGAMAASAFFKLTGVPAACLTIGGPGATNLATGLYDAKEDRAAVIALAGQVEYQYAGPGGFQEIDQDSFFRPIAVYNATIHDPEKAVQITTAAVRHALLAPGVGQISVPNNVQKMPFDAPYCSGASCLPGTAISPPAAALDRAVQAIAAAERPVVLAGWGAYPHGALVHALARRCSAPVLTTFRAKGILPEESDLVIGVLGSLGPPDARRFAEESDLLIALGVGFSKQTNVPLDRLLVQVDLDPLKIGKSPQTIGLWGDCGVVLSRLVERVPERRDEDREKAIAESKARWTAQLAAETESGDGPLRPPFIMRVLSAVLPPDAAIGLDVGENGWWFGRNFVSRGQRFAMSGYLATMGFGFPATIAAKLAYPDRPAVCITGDGGFAMAMGDLVTAVRRRLPMTICVLNNHQYGMIQVEQAMEGYPNFGTDLANPDFAAYARACGADGVRIETPDAFRPALEAALHADRVTVLDIETDPRRFP
jgi:pyruvate oxidase